MTQTSVLTVPGWHGSEACHWQTIWESRYPAVSRVEQSDWERPELDRWIATLDGHVRRRNGPVVLVAHSLGCLAVAHWARTVPKKCNVAAALLVAPPWCGSEQSCPRETRAFVPAPANALPFRSILVASRNDPYLPFAAAAELGSRWGSMFIDAGFAGHINVSSGHGEWPQGEHLLKTLLPQRALLHRQEKNGYQNQHVNRGSNHAAHNGRGNRLHHV
jgi:predicted alpha/beta hydrolase family esterase